VILLVVFTKKNLWKGSYILIYFTIYISFIQNYIVIPTHCKKNEE